MTDNQKAGLNSQKTKKRNLSCLRKMRMLLILIFVFMGVVNCAKAQVVDSGTCGVNLTWVLTIDSVLTISGSGAMYNYEVINSPWYPHRTKIKTIDLGSEITTIGDWAFASLNNLKSAEISNSVITIGEGAFAGCGLMSIEIPNSVKTIKSAFETFSCKNLLSINVDTNNPNYSSNNGILYNKLQNSLLCCPKGKTGILVIPNTVITIGMYAFRANNKLTSIEISNSVNSIGYGAFWYCEGLTSVIIGNSVNSIGLAAFYECNNLNLIISKASIPPTFDMESSFYEVPATNIVVPCNTSLDYQNSTWGNIFTNFIEDCTDIKEIVQNNQITIYPTPTNNNFFIDYKDFDYIKLYDISGKEVLNQSIYEKNEINISHLPQGIYNIQIFSNEKLVGSSKIVKQ